MTGSSSHFYDAIMPRDGSRSLSRKAPSIASGSSLARIKAFLFGRRPTARCLPPLKNAHYVAVHMAATTRLGSLR